MPVSDQQMLAAWKHVLRLSNLEAGQTVTVLTGPDSHPQTLSTALIAAAELGAIVNRLDLPPKNGEKSLSRDSLAYVGATPLNGNRAAVSLLKESDLARPDDPALFERAGRDSRIRHQDPAGGRTAGNPPAALAAGK